MLFYGSLLVIILSVFWSVLLNFSSLAIIVCSQIGYESKILKRLQERELSMIAHILFLACKEMQRSSVEPPLPKKRKNAMEEFDAKSHCTHIH
jgi:hypothetical protein